MGGTLYKAEPCNICNYQVKEGLKEGIKRLTLLKLAACKDCREIVSVDVPFPNDTLQVLGFAEGKYLEHVRKHYARKHETFEFNTCPRCQGQNVELLTINLTGQRDSAWVDCPRCAEGRVYMLGDMLWD